MTHEQCLVQRGNGNICVNIVEIVETFPICFENTNHLNSEVYFRPLLGVWLCVTVVGKLVGGKQQHGELLVWVEHQKSPQKRTPPLFVYDSHL
jgi:hypothetical protein